MANKSNPKKELWAGTIDSLHEAQAASEKMAAMTDVNAPVSERLSIVGGVGVIQISGSLVNNDSPWNKYMGVTSYNDIRSALAEAVGNPLIKQIVLDINSGGGAVSGITDTAALIAQINKFVKPVVAYTGGVMASGAYWLGASAGRIVASDVAVVGSIGVITSHMDYSKMYEDDGVKATVIRAGKYKQLNSPLEPLSDIGLSEIQSQLEQVYSVFVQHVADSRSVSYSVADTQMAQGREFIGASALTAGLVDSVSTFDALMSELVTKVALDSNKSFSNNNLKPILKGKNMTMSLNEQQLAVISAGGSLSPEEIAAATALAASEAAKEEADKEAEAEASAGADEAGNTEAASAEFVEGLAVSNDAGVVDYLKAQLAEVNAGLLESTVQLRTLQASTSEALASQAGLLSIAYGAVNKMNVALGGSERDLSGMSAVALLAEHAKVSEDFNKKFKVGGVAVATLDKNAEVQTVKATALHTARIKAVKEGK